MEGQVREGKSYTHADALKVGFRVVPAADGSFICYVGACECWGFTNVTDLLTWLQRAAQARQAAEVMVLDQPYEGGQFGKVNISAESAAVHAGLRRTTAVGSLADRLAAAEQPKGAA